MMQQIGMLNLRINDMMTQLNAVIENLVEENAMLKKKNAESREPIQEASAGLNKQVTSKS